jgi:hypothetical protein
MLSSASDCIIFLYLGMALLGDQVWHTGEPLFKGKVSREEYFLKILKIKTLLYIRGGQFRNLFCFAHFRNLRNKEICCGCAL